MDDGTQQVQNATTYNYKKNMRESKLARRGRRHHSRGRDFTKVLGYQFATKNLERMASKKAKSAGHGLRERIKEIVG